MAESEHDDLADALANMANGNAFPSEYEPAPAQVPPAPVTPPPARPAPRPAMAQPAPPASPAIPKPTAPVRPPAPRMAAPPGAATARPSRPSAPSLASAPVQPVNPPVDAAPPARPQRPTAPTLRQDAAEPAAFQQPPTDSDQSTGLNVQEIFDDEDAVIVPAPEASAFIPKPKAATSEDFRAKAVARKRLEFRRTLIPVLLTTGVLCFFFSVIKYCLGPDSPLTTLPIWVPALLIVSGCVLLVFAVINMLSVRAELAAAGK